MQRHDNATLYSASDLVAFLACEHSTALSLRNLETPLAKAKDDASAKLVQDKGMEHERAVLASFKARGLRVAELPEHGDPGTLAKNTEAAMRDGADVIYQGTFVDAPFFGRTDFLRRVAHPSHLGDYSYEVVDTKLARSPKAKFAVQLALYSDLLTEAQGTQPHAMHVTLGDGREALLQVAEYREYIALARARFLAFVSNPPVTYPQRCEACGMCPWRELCDERWKADDHLNQVAGITAKQIERMNDAGVRTVAQLAVLPAGTKVPKVGVDTVAKLVAQSALQVARRETGAPRYELLPPDDERRRGFHRMPTPDAGDVFFDMEGDPYQEGGLEYLFGVRYDDGAGSQFRGFWAHDRAQERTAFEAFIDFVVERMARYPDLHVYHYNHYEPTALKRLMTSHGTREAALDDLLRGEKFVDLYKVVRECMRTSEDGLSIKDLEVFYMPPRQGDIQDAGASTVHYETWRQTRDPAELDRIQAYNEDDCRSTQLLRDWLLSLRPEGMPWFTLARKEDRQEREMSERAKEIELALEQRRQALLAGVPENEEARDRGQETRVLLAQLLDFHRRADKPAYWELFSRRDMTDDDLVEDVECLGGLVRTERPPAREKRSFAYEFTYPEQETKLREGKDCTRCDTAERMGEILSLDTVARRITIKTTATDIPRCLSIGPTGPIDNKVLRNAVWRVADAVIEGDTGRYAACLKFLRRDPPSLHGRAKGAPLVEGRNDLAAEALRAVESLDDSYLFIQGPPGAGKTTLGSQLIVELLRKGKRVGVTSNSHKVINNLLAAVEKRAAKAGFHFDGVKKSGRDEAESEFDGRFVRPAKTNDEVVLSGAALVAGTAWLFADPRFEACFDYVFVDEAGQVSLANLLAVGTAARNLVLLGDHMQLGQPIQGAHPGRSGESALDYLLDGLATVPADRGIFLPTSYRMHQDVCRFISDAVYDGRLAAHADNQRRRLVLDRRAHPALRPTGIRFLGVEHANCKQSSAAEAREIEAMFASLLGQRWIDKDGSEKAITPDDILVVAPYNAQVNLLRETLPEGARIGTIDKFQGQEAPVVLVSMTTSSGADLPRNIEFLFDKNRINVAVSRAMCLSVVVASPALLHVDCNTPGQMALVNTLCWLKAYAEELPACTL
jgi:uncharacterized protein